MASLTMVDVKFFHCSICSFNADQKASRTTNQMMAPMSCDDVSLIS